MFTKANHSMEKKVMEVSTRELYCFECSFQLKKKYAFDVHLSLVHGEKLEIKQEPKSQPSPIPELQITHPEKESIRKIESKRSKVSMKTASGQKGMENFKCGIGSANFGLKSNLKKHVETVHDGKKQFRCDICNATFGQKQHLNRHVATVHEGKKQFRCDICNANFGYKSDLKKHVSTVHEGKKLFKCQENVPRRNRKC